MRNGSGGYSLPSNSWNPAVNGVTATAADWQALINDVATAIQQSISADGQTPITGNLAMGGNKLTGLAAGSGTGQSLRYEQLFSQGTLTDIASAATTDIGTPLSNFLRVTGTTGITSFGTNYNGPRFMIFAGAVLLTHSATLVLPGAANITTAANDCLISVPISGGWQVVAYQKADGTSLVASIGNTLASATTTGTSTAYTITPTPVITAYAANISYWVTFHTTSGTTPTLQISGVATPPNLVKQDATGAYVNIQSGDIPTNHRSRVTLISATQALVEELPPSVLRSYLTGYTLSTAGSSTTMSIAVGSAADSTNSLFINLNSAISKTVSNWSVGSAVGGLDTGTIANSTWYYFYAIRRPDTSVVDVVFSLSSSAPTLPSNYTQFRYIGAGLTNGSGQWTAFTQVGDDFFWSSPVNDFNGAGPTTASLLTCSLPRGRKVKGDFSVTGNQTSGTDITVYLSDPANADATPSQANGVSVVSTSASGISGYQTSKAAVWTNTSGQVRLRASSTQTVRITTFGWTDLRGKDL